MSSKQKYLKEQWKKVLKEQQTISEEEFEASVDKLIEFIIGGSDRIPEWVDFLNKQKNVNFDETDWLMYRVGQRFKTGTNEIYDQYDIENIPEGEDLPEGFYEALKQLQKDLAEEYEIGYNDVPSSENFYNFVQALGKAPYISP
jgi:hypothetical protein